MKNLNCIPTLLLLSFGTAHGQPHEIRAINIRTALDTGSVLVSLIPSTGADSTALFDGDPQSDMAMPAMKSLRVTLEFDHAVDIERSRLFLMNRGEWKLECAQNTIDLDRRRASFKVLGKGTGFSPGTWSEIT